MKEYSKAERLFYLIASVFAPCIPLFFLYNKNVAEGILFRHCLLFGLALAAVNLILYVVLALVFRTRSAALILIAVLWAVFWYVGSLHGLLLRVKDDLPLLFTASTLLLLIAIAFVCLAYIKMPKAVGQALGLTLCVLFAFNFLPAAYTAIKTRTALAVSGNVVPYEIKSRFAVDSSLPQPNIYWLHMDGMIGFDSFERYFDDPQEDLKNTLKAYGFVINETARLDGGATKIAIPMLMAPTIYDSWLSSIVEEYAHLTSSKRREQLFSAVKNQGLDLIQDIYPELDLPKALSKAGYKISGNGNVIRSSKVADILNNGKTITFLDNSLREAEADYAQLTDFKELIVEASALKLFENSINSLVNNKMKTSATESKTEDIPAYENIVQKYRLKDSESNARMDTQVRAVQYATEMDSPHFFYLDDQVTHFFVNTKTIGYFFNLDENGNKIQLREKQKTDPSYNIYDVSYYAGQHRYGVKLLQAKLKIIIENDPDAVIIVQGDHGIHGLGPAGTGYFFDEKTFEKQGYTIEDMQNFNKSVISAVRIPPQYGKLSQPLEPLDITRYLVNHFVGEDNYDYVSYQE